MNRTAVLYALASAALFGISTPAAKGLVGTVNPIVLAGLLYCGAGIGVAVLSRLAHAVLAPAAREQSLRRQDIPWLAGAIAAGGVAGPILLMTGLARTDAAAASLLLTLEGAATALMAWFIFRENFNRRIGLGMVLLVAGAAALAWSGTPTLTSVIGPVAIIGACIMWGLDNNLTRKVSLADPLQIVELKGLIAGPVSVAIGLWAGGSLPGAFDALLAGIVGFFGYGVSLALFVVALRHLGAARTGAYFSTAPFLGAVVAVVALGEPVTVQLLVAGGLMGLGVWLHLTERHEHEHIHQPMMHAHSHVHDEHHRHQHNSEDPPGSCTTSIGIDFRGAGALFATANVVRMMTSSAIAVPSPLWRGDWGEGDVEGLSVSRTRCSAKRCIADRGPSPTGTVPVLQRTASRCAAPGTRE